jgi:hypothetical protein
MPCQPIHVTISAANLITAHLSTAQPIIVTLTGGAGVGVTDHAVLTNLDYAHAGHIGFQKKVDWDEEYNSFLIDRI